MNMQKNLHMIFRMSLLVFFAANCWYMLYVGLDVSTQSLRDNTLGTLWTTGGMLLAALGYLFLAHSRPRLNATDICVIMLFTWVTLCYLLSNGLASGLKYDSFLQVAMVYIALRIIFSAERYAGVMLLILLWGFCIQEALVGIRQAYGLVNSNHGLFKITGTFFNPGPYAGFIAPLFVCAAVYITQKRQTAKHIFLTGSLWKSRPGISLAIAIPYLLSWGTVLAALVILPATMSRAALIAVVSGCSLLLLHKLNLKSWFRSIYAANPIRTWVFAVSGLFLFGVAATGAYLMKKPSAEGRLLMWKIDTRIMGHNPVFGAGLGNFAGAYGMEQAAYFAEAERSEAEIQVAGCPESGFNEYLEFGAETGIIGFGLLLLTVGTAIVSMVRSKDLFGYGLFTAAVFACFSYPWSVLPLRLMFVMLFAGVGREYTVGSRKGSRIIIGLLLVGCFAFWPGLYRRYAARIKTLRQWEDVRIWLKVERYDYLVEDGARLQLTLRENFRFLYDYGYALHKTGDYLHSNEVLALGMQISSDPMFWNIAGKNYEALGDFLAAEKAYQHAYHMIPHRIYPLYLLSRHYVAAGQPEKACSTAHLALLRPPKIESIQTRSMQTELRQLLDSLSGSTTNNL